MLLILIAICFINLGSFAAAKGCKQTSLKVLRLMIAKKKKNFRRVISSVIAVDDV